MMTAHAVATAAEFHIPAVWIVFNNFAFGSIRDLQLAYFSGRQLATSFVDVESGKPYNPDFGALARGYGVNGARVERPGDFGPILREALESERPSVIEVLVDPFARPVGTGTWQLPPLPSPLPGFGGREHGGCT